MTIERTEVSGSVRRFLALTLIGMTSLTFHACGDDGGSGPTGPARVALSLQGAMPEDAAVLLEIGPGCTGVEGIRGDVEVHSVPVRDGFSVAVFGPLGEDPILVVELEEASVTPEVTLREVAVSDGSLRTSLAGYRAQWKRVR